MNTVLDDNRILTLANGDRIPMTDNVKLMFEVEDLRNASPATVSRAGIIFVSNSDLDWQPVLQAWLNRKPANLSAILTRLFIQYVGKCDGPKSFGHLFYFLQKNCKSVVVTTRVGVIEGCCHLLDGLLNTIEISDNMADELERIFIYALAWSTGGLLEVDGRIKFTQYILSVGTSQNIFPNMENEDTLFEFRVNHNTKQWEKWAAPNWVYPSQIEEPDFSSMLIPTIESNKALFLLKLLHSQNLSVLLTGSNGTAKTSSALMFFDSVLGQVNNDMRLKKICFSSATTPANFQYTLESELDK